MEERPTTARWRIGAAVVLFGLSLGWPVALPVLPVLGVSGKGIAAFTGGMVAVAEILLVVAAAVAGKEGFETIKATIFAFLKSHGPPRMVGRTRYRVGLVLFAGPLLLGWAAPYFGHHLPRYDENPTAYAIAGDGALLVGLFLLGGEFWSKLRSLFVREATAAFPSDPAA